jgi:hypothetical protein
MKMLLAAFGVVMITALPAASQPSVTEIEPVGYVCEDHSGKRHATLYFEGGEVYSQIDDKPIKQEAILQYKAVNDFGNPNGSPPYHLAMAWWRPSPGRAGAASLIWQAYEGERPAWHLDVGVFPQMEFQGRCIIANDAGAELPGLYRYGTEKEKHDTQREDVWFCTGEGDVAVAVDRGKMEATLYPGGFYGGPRRSTMKMQKTGPGTFAFEGYAVKYIDEGRELTRPTRPEVHCEAR